MSENRCKNTEIKDNEALSVRDSSAAETRNMEYTIDDYYALPDRPRVELIDGDFYTMEAPSLAHQDIILELAVQFRECLKKQAHLHSELRHVFVSPCDVQLDADDYTMVQPDLFISCDGSKLTKACFVGAPDLIVEVLSPSSRCNLSFYRKEYI